MLALTELSGAICEPQSDQDQLLSIAQLESAESYLLFEQLGSREELVESDLQAALMSLEPGAKQVSFVGAEGLDDSSGRAVVQGEGRLWAQGFGRSLPRGSRGHEIVGQGAGARVVEFDRTG